MGAADKNEPSSQFKSVIPLLFVRLDHCKRYSQRFQQIENAFRNDKAEGYRDPEIVAASFPIYFQPHERWQLQPGLILLTLFRGSHLGVGERRTLKAHLLQCALGFLSDEKTGECRNDHITEPALYHIVKPGHDWRMDARVENGVFADPASDVRPYFKVSGRSVGRMPPCRLTCRFGEFRPQASNPSLQHRPPKSRQG